jgi:hypothetical protein
MHISKVSFKRNYAISPLTMEHMHLGVEIELNAGEDAKDALKQAQALVEEYYKESFTNSAATPYQGNMAVPDHQIEKPIGTMIAEMEACTTLQDIKSFHLTIKNEQEQDVYNRKLQELSQ